MNRLDNCDGRTWTLPRCSYRGEYPLQYTVRMCVVKGKYGYEILRTLTPNSNLDLPLSEQALPAPKTPKLFLLTYHSFYQLICVSVEYTYCPGILAI